jgi:hypothetical protein
MPAAFVVSNEKETITAKTQFLSGAANDHE